MGFSTFNRRIKVTCALVLINVSQDIYLHFLGRNRKFFVVTFTNSNSTSAPLDESKKSKSYLFLPAAGENCAILNNANPTKLSHSIQAKKITGKKQAVVSVCKN